MDADTRTQLIDYLTEYVSPERLERIKEVLSNRTRYISLVLEDIYKPQNASATLRTCDGLGIQDVHVIENDSPFSLDGDIDLGSAQWITLHRYREKGRDNAETCYAALRDRGYVLVATTPNENSRSLQDLPFDKKLALVFGNEEKGLSDYTLQEADYTVRLPMYGFTQSFNISASVAITLMYLVEKMRGTNIGWGLTDDEKEALTLEWLRKSIRRCDLIEKKFFDSYKGLNR